MIDATILVFALNFPRHHPRLGIDSIFFLIMLLEISIIPSKNIVLANFMRLMLFFFLNI